jgi:hypothetical protein
MSNIFWVFNSAIVHSGLYLIVCRHFTHPCCHPCQAGLLSQGSANWFTKQGGHWCRGSRSILTSPNINCPLTRSIGSWWCKKCGEDTACRDFKVSSLYWSTQELRAHVHQSEFSSSLFTVPHLRRMLVRPMPRCFAVNLMQLCIIHRLSLVSTFLSMITWVDDDWPPKLNAMFERVSLVSHSAHRASGRLKLHNEGINKYESLDLAANNRNQFTEMSGDPKVT